MRKITDVLISVLLLLSLNAQAQKIGAFESLTTKTVGPKTVAVPYTDVVSYLGYAAPGANDREAGGKKFYDIYVWIPAVVTEMGARMWSPASIDAKYLSKASGTAFRSPSYSENADSKDYFDTYIVLQRSDIIKPEDVTKDKVASAKWWDLEKNDDSPELPANPSGSSYNSVLKVKSQASDPLNSLVRGLYRVGFTTYKIGDVNGTFCAEIGSPVKLPGVVVGTLDQVIEALQLQQESNGK